MPLAFQLTARLNSVTDSEGHAVDPLFCLEESLSQTEWQGPNGTQADDYSFGDGAGQTGQTLDDSGNVDQAAAAAAFQQALRALLVEISVTDSEGPQLVLYQLLAELADEETAGQGGGKGKAPAAAAAGSSPSKLAAAAVQQGRRSAATSLLQEIKQRVSEPAAIDATIAMAKALRSLAHCPNPPSMPKGGGRVSISDALSAAGISALQDVSQLSDLGHRIELVNVPPAVPSSLCEGVCLTRFLPYYVALPSGVPENVGGSGADSKDGAGSKLIWCEDESGTQHALLLKAGSAGTLDTRRDALVQQFVEEFNQLLNDEPHARKRGLKVRGRRVLPLAPSCALYEYRPHAVGMHTFLSAEHAAAYEAGRERKALPKCEEELIKAHMEDASQQTAGGERAIRIHGRGRRGCRRAGGWAEGQGGVGARAERHLAPTPPLCPSVLAVARSVACPAAAPHALAGDLLDRRLASRPRRARAASANARAGDGGGASRRHAGDTDAAAGSCSGGGKHTRRPCRSSTALSAHSGARRCARPVRCRRPLPLRRGGVPADRSERARERGPSYAA